MFNQLKLSWGLKEAWQQTRQTLHRWVHLTLVGYGLIHHVPVRQWWNRKCRKFEPPNWRGSEQDAAISV
ncbi:hypothetical protein [Thiolapillus sp.]|uniref:hypothetical protein n=1 Tax=Thiolapillus sp. TaxID=2017437 RepID=UPI0025E99C59|nr:hypothetical protein [Thiolapillus sp.]